MKLSSKQTLTVIWARGLLMMFAVGKSMENCEKFTPKILRFMSYLDCLINCKLKHRMELQEMFIFQSKSSCVYITLPTIHLPLALYLISFHLWWSNDQLNTKTVSPLLSLSALGQLPGLNAQCLGPCGCCPGGVPGPYFTLRWTSDSIFWS